MWSTITREKVGLEGQGGVGEPAIAAGASGAARGREAADRKAQRRRKQAKKRAFRGPFFQVTQKFLVRKAALEQTIEREGTHQTPLLFPALLLEHSLGQARLLVDLPDARLRVNRKGILRGELEVRSDHIFVHEGLVLVRKHELAPQQVEVPVEENGVASHVHEVRIVVHRHG